MKKDYIHSLLAFFFFPSCLFLNLIYIYSSYFLFSFLLGHRGGGVGVGVGVGWGGGILYTLLQCRTIFPLEIKVSLVKKIQHLSTHPFFPVSFFPPLSSSSPFFFFFSEFSVSPVERDRRLLPVLGFQLSTSQSLVPCLRVRMGPESTQQSSRPFLWVIG